MVRHATRAIVSLAIGSARWALIAAWTHLLPSARVLGALASCRLVALNAGIALLALGIPTGAGTLVAAGDGLANVAGPRRRRARERGGPTAATLATSLALLVGAALLVRAVPAPTRR